MLSDGAKVEVALERVFIPSKLQDNPKMLDSQPTYILQLRQTGSEQLVRAWLEGDWNSVQGSYFSEFSPDKHILPASFAATIPKHWTRFRAMDWGSARPFCVGWYAVSDGKSNLPPGAIVKYREFYGWNGKPNQGLKMNASAVAKGILAQDALDSAAGSPLSYGLADPSIFVQDGGPSIAEMMLAEGCHWGRADNKRLAGWEQLHVRFQADPPLLYFLENCEHTIRTIPTLQHDEHKPEDLDSEGEDHAADETRYACASRPLVTQRTVAQASFRLPLTIERFTFNDLLEKNKMRRLEAEGNW